jgi:DNA polymerase/3'-5' exonuclease PolX
MLLEKAVVIAERVKAVLAPHCDRIEIAGSIRRCKAEVGDVEIVCIPKKSAGGHRDIRWVLAADSLGRRLKGDLATGKYVQLQTWFDDDGPMKVDVFTARRENWGLIYAIRTGSAEYSHKVLACGWVRNGYHSVEGMLTRDGDKSVRDAEMLPVYEEEDLFRMAGVPWVKPEERGG